MLIFNVKIGKVRVRMSKGRGYKTTFRFKKIDFTGLFAPLYSKMVTYYLVWGTTYYEFEWIVD